MPYFKARLATYPLKLLNVPFTPPNHMFRGGSAVGAANRKTLEYSSIPVGAKSNVCLGTGNNNSAMGRLRSRDAWRKSIFDRILT